MHPLIVASLNYTHEASFRDAASTFVAGRSLIWGWVTAHWRTFSAWLSQPDVIIFLITWWITFTLVITLLLGMGFSLGGVLAGTVAAAYQSWMYGGFTPAAGLFATLTSVGMLGLATPIFTGIAALIATLVASVTWYYVRG